MNPEVTQETQEPIDAVGNTEVVANQEPTQNNSQAEQNWRHVRQELEQMRYEKMRLEEQLRAQHQVKAAPEEEEDLGDPSDLVTKAELKKYAEKLAKKQVEKILEEREKLEIQKDRNSAPTRLKHKFSDFEQVVNQETLEKFTQQEPELAESLGMLAHDPFKQGVAVYKVLKSQQGEKTNSSSPQVRKMPERPPTSSSATPKQSSALSNANLFANGLTDELKKQLYKEMEEASMRY